MFLSLPLSFNFFLFYLLSFLHYSYPIFQDPAGETGGPVKFKLTLTGCATNCNVYSIHFFWWNDIHLSSYFLTYWMLLMFLQLHFQMHTFSGTFTLVCPESLVNKICSIWTKKIKSLHLSLITQYMFTASLAHQVVSRNIHWSHRNHIMEPNLMFF